MPDALSKTVPIWCAVVNRAICLRYPELAENWDTALYTPPSVVTKNEHEQIEKLLNNWAQDLQVDSFQLDSCRKQLMHGFRLHLILYPSLQDLFDRYG